MSREQNDPLGILLQRITQTIAHANYCTPCTVYQSSRVCGIQWEPIVHHTHVGRVQHVCRLDFQPSLEDHLSNP